MLCNSSPVAAIFTRADDQSSFDRSVFVILTRSLGRALSVPPRADETKSSFGQSQQPITSAFCNAIASLLDLNMSLEPRLEPSSLLVPCFITPRELEAGTHMVAIDTSAPVNSEDFTDSFPEILWVVTIEACSEQRSPAWAYS